MIVRSIVILFLLAVSAAHAQPVSVIGPVTPGNIPVFNSPTVIKDGGVAPGLVVGSTPITGGNNRGELFNDNGFIGNLPSIVYDVRKYAVVPKTEATVCNGSGDDTATIQAAASAANSNVAGVVLFPASACITASTLDLTNYGNVRFQGQGVGKNLFAAKTSITYTAATGSALKLDGTIGFVSDGISWQYSHATYNGDLIDARQVSGTLNTNLITFSNCFIGGNSGTAASLIRLGGPSGALGTLSFRADKCFFQGGIQAIKGGLNSNNVYIGNSFFQTNAGTVSHVGVMGEGWTLLNNTFEPTAGTVANNVVANGATNGLSIIGNTFNDSVTGTLITLTGGVVTGLSVTGNILQGGDFSINAGSGVGVSIIGNYLNANNINNIIVNSATKVTVLSNWGPGTLVGTLPASDTYLIDRNNGTPLIADSGFTFGTPLAATSGGTGFASYAVGDLLYADTTTTLAKLADVATGNAVISSGVGVAPSWGKIGISTHVSGLGTGVATALGVNVGTAGAFVVNGGVLGTPSSGTVTNLTGTASININGTVGATTPNTGAFTSLAYSTTMTGTSSNAACAAIGLNGATNPVFKLDCSTASQAAGFQITGAATGGTVALAAIDSGSNTNLTINAKGSGTIGIGLVSTGAVTVTPALTASTSISSPTHTASGALTFQSNGSTFAGNISTGQLWFIGSTSLTAAAGSQLTVSQNTGGTPTVSSLANILLQAIAADSTIGLMSLDTFGAQGFLASRYAGGTQASKTAVAGGVTTFSFGGQAWDGSVWATGGAMDFATSASTWSGSNHGMNIRFRVVANGATTLTEAARISDSGGFSVGTTTDPGVGSAQLNAQFFMPNITTTSAAQTGTVCWTTGTGKFTADTTVGCLASIMAAKNVIERLSPEKALDIVAQLSPFAFRYKSGYGDSGHYEQFGLGAEEVSLVDERLVGRDPEGSLQGVRYQELTAVLAAAIQNLNERTLKLERSFR